MTIRTLPVVLASLALFGVAAPAHAGKDKKGKKAAAQAARVLAHLDRDHNGTIDGKEAKRAQTLYAALATLDTDHNGQLSDSEIAAAKIPTGATGKGAKKKKTQ